MQRNTGYFPTESLEPCGNRLFSRSALNEGYLFRGSLTYFAYSEGFVKFKTGYASAPSIWLMFAVLLVLIVFFYGKKSKAK